MKTLDVACISGWKLNFLFFRQRGKLIFGCKVNIIDTFDLNRYPSWCKAVLKDCNGAEHILIDKLPVIGLEEKEVSSLPIEKFIAVEIINDLGNTVEIDTAVLWGIETQEGKSRFVVSKELIKEL